MAASQRPPVGDAAKLWETARAHLAQKDFDTPAGLASDAQTHCKAEGVRYGEAAATLVLGLAGLGRSTPQGAELLALYPALGLGWGEAAELLHLAERRVAAEGAAGAAAKAATAAAAAGSDPWTKAAELSVVAYAGLKKDGPAMVLASLQEALKLCAQVGLTWGEDGALGSAARVHRSGRETEAELKEALSSATRVQRTGKEKEAELKELVKAEGTAQLKAAGAWMQREEPEQALQAARQALSTFRELGDKEMEATALRAVASAQLDEGAPLEALQAGNQAAALFRELGHRRGEAYALLTISQAQAARYSAEEAAWKASDALKFFRQLGCRMEEGLALDSIAKSSILEGDFAKGLAVATQAMDLAVELGDGLKEGQRLCLISQMHEGQGKFEEGLEAARKAQTILRNLGDATLELQALDAMVSIYCKQERLQDALHALKEARQSFQAAQEEKQEALVLCKIAEIHTLTLESDLGIGAAREAGKIFAMLRDKVGRARALRLEGELFACRGDDQNARQSAEEAISLYQEVGRVGLSGYISAEDTIINSFVSAGLYDEALIEAKKALKYFNSKREKRCEASIMTAIAGIEERRGNVDAALKTLQQVPGLFLAAGDKRGEAASWMEIAKLHMDKNEPDLALHAAEEAQTAYRKLGDKAGKVRACQLVAEANFSLVPNGYGSARAALAAAQEALALHRAGSDKQAEASALNTLANAQLMSREFQEAKKSAYQAEELFQELGDVHGQASAQLLTSGANLGDGRFADAKTAAEEALDLFRSCGDSFGEDNADEFIEQLSQYQTGQLSRADFCGFSVRAPDESAQRKPRRRAPRPRHSEVNLEVQDLELFDYGTKGTRSTTAYFHGYTSRNARTVQAKPPSTTADQAGLKDRQAKTGVPVKREQVLYTVKFVKNPIPPSTSRDASPHDLSDRRSGRAMMLETPDTDWSRVGPSSRMLQSFGGDRGV